MFDKLPLPSTSKTFLFNKLEACAIDKVAQDVPSCSAPDINIDMLFFLFVVKNKSSYVKSAQLLTLKS